MLKFKNYYLNLMLLIASILVTGDHVVRAEKNHISSADHDKMILAVIQYQLVDKVFGDMPHRLCCIRPSAGKVSSYLSKELTTERVELLKDDPYSLHINPPGWTVFMDIADFKELNSNTTALVMYFSTSHNPRLDEVNGGESTTNFYFRKVKNVWNLDPSRTITRSE